MNKLTPTEALKQIRRQLTGIQIEDMNKAEKNIIAILKIAGFATIINEHGTVEVK